MKKTIIFLLISSFLLTAAAVAAGQMGLTQAYEGRKTVDAGANEPGTVDAPEVSWLNSLQGYWQGTRVGDWVKYLARLDGKPVIEVWTVEEFNEPDREAYISRVYYGDEGDVIREEEFSVDLDMAEETWRIFQEGKKEKRFAERVEEVVADFNGRKIAGDLKVGMQVEWKTDRWGWVTGKEVMKCNVDMYSMGVRVGGKVYNGNWSFFDYLYLADGTIADRDSKKVSPGDLTALVEAVKPVPDEIKAVMEEKKKHIEKEPITIHEPIADIKDDMKPASEKIRAKLNGLEGYWRGVRVGDWCKLIIRGHHIQVWIVYEIVELGKNDVEIKFRRRFYNDDGELYDINNASTLVAEAEKMYGQYKTDPSFVVDKKIDELVLPGGKCLSARLLVRKASMGSMVRILSRENPVEGHVMSMFKSELFYVLLDCGCALESDRKAVRKGDVARAKKWLVDWVDKELPKHWKK